MAKLTFNYGCMGSGKTTRMLTQFDLYKRRRKKPLIIKPCIDTRETGEEKFVGWGVTKSRITRNEEPVYYFDTLNDVITHLEYGVLFVDEAQFLTREEVVELARIVDINNIDVFCFGLKTDVNGNLFEGAKHLFALADEFIEFEHYVFSESQDYDFIEDWLEPYFDESVYVSSFDDEEESKSERLKAILDQIEQLAAEARKIVEG